METRFEMNRASGAVEVSKILEHSNHLGLESEGIGLPKAVICKTSKFLGNHPEFSEMIFAIEKSSRETVGSILMTFQFDVERNTDTLALNSIFVSKNYRAKEWAASS